MYNRDIPIEQQEKWLAAGWESIYDWLDLNDNYQMEEACKILYDHITANHSVRVIVDSDTDGFTSATIIINYLNKTFPEWATSNNLFYSLHSGKQHGLADLMDEIQEDLVICPDSGTNDIEQHKELAAKGIDCIILDHHLVEDKDAVQDSPATIINVQLSNYPNKSLTGAGVAYKFVSAFEDLYIHGNQPTEYMDLCALGNCADMADYRELEIRGIINVGFSDIKNPFIYHMCQQHKYTLDKRGGINYLSMAFAVVPFINAICRSGTEEEKSMVFEGMCVPWAFEDVESSKRGEKGMTVSRYKEAVVVAERVKRRQDKLTQETVEILDRKIQEENLTDNAIITLLCEPDEVEANIAGLVANKVQAKYQHPTLVLRRTRGLGDKEDFYRGSGRNYSYCPIEDMKTMCAATGDTEFQAGHAKAFGLGVAASKIQDFIRDSNKLYRDVDFTPVYWVDYIWEPQDLNPQTILEIADLNIWGQEMPQATVAIKNIPLSENNVTILGLAKGKPTLKIECNGIELMKFQSSEEEYEQFIQPNTYLTVIGTCNKNVWNDIVKPQIMIDDFELEQRWVF